jgi:hypothetical protein
MLPSYTQMGMAALLPNKELMLQMNVNFAFNFSMIRINKLQSHSVHKFPFLEVTPISPVQAVVTNFDRGELVEGRNRSFLELRLSSVGDFHHLHFLAAVVNFIHCWLLNNRVG